VSRTEQRACPVCGTAFTWTSASPRQKYCSTRCAQLCWERAHRRRSQRQPAAGDPGRHDDQARHDDDAHHDDDARHDDDPRRPDGNGQPPAAIAACPHCRKPVAIVAWLIPPAAATITAPAPRQARPAAAAAAARTGARS
jgi:endogenous inhibitor of DNA gyrase (YacG/DUF329 family)